jgi:class 3 adenylate cyclase
MAFVNEIAEIVHGIVYRFSGATNKNIGDSFLCVWKFREEDTEIDSLTGNLCPRHESNAAR